MKKVNYKEKGITLIALVITIIILLILAGVTISTALGQNGLFQRAKLAAEEYKNSSIKEDENLKLVEKELDNIEELNDKEGTYIRGEEDFNKFVKEVNSGNNFEGKRVYLTTDIELAEGNNWEPIGNESNTFKGTFDGRNKKISNINGTYDGSNGTSVGLFGVVENATIKNVTVTGEIKATGTVEEAGGIVGKSNGNVKIEGCTNNINITSDGHAGGCIGRVSGENCKVEIDKFTNTGNITSTGAGGDGGTGGCIGWISPDIRKCNTSI